ncbi:hypothetical protein VE04_00784 [Pseudogymnoascus sp. 24MN13]|uniref:Cytochrome b5 heme-binding domain-containing protein n=1 Tax=Pseudogymnoascus verrucosus TaxID=342668 RepID=A0A1B8GAM9_9PEZI|nr:uncharacterized protein VE01_08945 [Pseudogymnoascus verrucosus]OBT58395.1 hypothetical protein VE04_00784 [Pseudogymnoascus sp. 24MN13]OBT92905.1 hypothetical protein VE01_08945 [Pseudogymnoascus verrucosus]
MSKVFSQSDVASHNKADDIWIIINNDVFDVTKFQDTHPGGKKVMQTVSGKDATKKFQKYHRDAILNKHREELQIGSLEVVETKPKSSSLFSFLKKS